MISCVRKIHFCSGHRVLGHENKCATPHGHNYIAWFYARAKDLDEIGRVIDFSVLKKNIGDWIDSNWDHTFLVYYKDHLKDLLIDLPGSYKQPCITIFNPTAENMAEYLLNTVCPYVLKDEEVQVYKVVIYETENCKAEATLYD